MAAFSDSDNAEIETNTERSVNIRDFIDHNCLPECVIVTDGSFISSYVQISAGDVVVLKSLECDVITLSYKDDDDSWKPIRVGADSSQQFKVLPPKDVGDVSESRNRVASVVFYPKVSDLLFDCPTYFEATATDFDASGKAVVQSGVKYRFEQLLVDPEGGQQRLKVRDENDAISVLPVDCRGNFYPLQDDRVYTLKDLVALACVPRRLKLHTSGSDQATHGSEPMPTSRPRSTASNLSSVSASSGSYHVVSDVYSILPSSFSGELRMYKPEEEVLACPFNDPDTVWNIPVDVNLLVRRYDCDDYEVPTLLRPSKTRANSKTPLLPLLPLPRASSDRAPRYEAPKVPPPQQPVVPVSVSSFADLYGESFPVKAKVFDTSSSSPFVRQLLESVDEVIVHRYEETRRLFVKDAKSDSIFSLSKDVRCHFIEYPQKFQTVSELLHLPVGTEVTVLEDIASDFPKPFFLRFGDIIKITSNNPHFVKIKHSSQEYPVVQCEKCSSERYNQTGQRMKIPLDFEMSMVISNDHASKTMVPLRKLLHGRAQIPRQTVASLPSEEHKDLLYDLPVDLNILGVVAEPVIVVSTPKRLSVPDSLASLFVPKSSSSQPMTSTTSSASSAIPQSIGIPLSSNVVLAFTERVRSHTTDNNKNFIRDPLKKYTQEQYEEVLACRKLSVSRSSSGNSGSREGNCGSHSGWRGRSQSMHDSSMMASCSDNFLEFDQCDDQCDDQCGPPRQRNASDG